MIRAAPLAALVLTAACAATLDHQAELLLHPEPAVAVPALAGAALVSAPALPLWGGVAALFGPESEAAGLALHAFAWPGALTFGGVPWLLAGPSFRH